MTNERLRGRPASTIRTWSEEVQVGVRLRLDLDPTAICSLFLSGTDSSTLIRQALEEFAVRHGLEGAKPEIQAAIVSQAASYAALGLVMTSSDYLSGKTPEEKRTEVPLESKSLVARVKKPVRPKEKRSLANEMPNIATTSSPIAAAVMDFGSPENSTPEKKFDQSDIGEKEQASDLASFGHVLLERYGGDDDY